MEKNATISGFSEHTAHVSPEVMEKLAEGETTAVSTEPEEVSLDDLNVGELGDVDAGAVFEESDFKKNKPEEYLSKEELLNAENRKLFIKSLSPEYKAEMVFRFLKEEGKAEVYGHNKRVYMRKLVREAKKGKLDKYFT